MSFSINPTPPTEQENAKPWWQKFAWFVGIYIVSILVVGGFVYGMRLLLGLHG